MTTMRRTLVVEPRPIGHRAFYLSLIVQALAGDAVSVLAPPDDPAILAHFQRCGLDPDTHDFIAPSGSGAPAVLAQVAALCRERHFDQVFFAYLDEFLPDLLKQVPSFPFPFSGIWFHPYALDRCNRWLPPIDKRLRQRRLIHHTLRKAAEGAGIVRLYFSDPAAVTALARVNPSIPATLLPDPWENKPSMDQASARRHFGLPEDRTIFLHIGSSEKRKGLADTISAFEKLDTSADVKLPLLLRVGENDRLGNAERIRLAALASKGMAKVIEGRVNEPDFIEYFAAADWILLPYRKFRFSSGILSNAIAADRPVIAADNGLIARMVRHQALGCLFRHRSRSGLQLAIERAITHRPTVDGSHADSLNPEMFIFRLRNCLPPDDSKEF